MKTFAICAYGKKPRPVAERIAFETGTGRLLIFFDREDAEKFLKENLSHIISEKHVEEIQISEIVGA